MTVDPASPGPCQYGPSFKAAGPTPEVSVRRAELDDLDAILDIGLAAMPLDPQWNWRFSRRFEYPDDHLNFTRQTYRRFLEDTTGSWYVTVAEITTGAVQQPVAFAVWNLSNLCPANQRGQLRTGPTKHSVSSHHDQGLAPSRRHVNERRMRAWTETIPKAKAKCFDAPLGRKFFQLQILATHPYYHRRGAGSALCNWGLQFSRLTGRAVAVFASPMGRLLYRRQGFVDVSKVRIQVQGEKDSIDLAAMLYFPQSTAFTIEM